MAITAVNSLLLAFHLIPHNRLMVSLFFMALNASVEGVTALKLDGDDIALRMVVRALGAGVYLRTVDERGWLRH
ncbi:hypothetical protein QMK33_21580 [Hymenobacter sp. H14-R3]|uniref:hypothetical protein n=1 Tax=Hymenobacter sp. H14-R3 TaxID=3046308 RepID=UPI0024BBC15C|nr:hypothetical protein [Hymenobacter sp. H14-R3]MDJ0367745.1 hypothetical protein [Hymenobacter sp. H14-R3]